MSSNNARLLKVPPNGQISIGKKWAGRAIRIQEISESEMLISLGTFVPDTHATYFTAEAKRTLAEFESWTEKNPPKRTDINALKAKLGKKAAR